MAEQSYGRIIKVAGPVIVAEQMTGARMYDVVRVGEENLIGDVSERCADSGRRRQLGDEHRCLAHDRID